jgi:uncharacterized protein YndB with AHSA1/START domain
MLLLKTATGLSPQPDVWTASADLPSDPDAVLDALTDPATIAQWAPVSFEVEGLARERLHAGSRERVSGSIAGIRATFEVEVARADQRGLQLVANGPVSLDVAFEFSEHDDGVIVDVHVVIRRRPGLTAQVMRAAVGALLNAGALGSSLRRLEASLPCPRECELLAA